MKKPKTKPTKPAKPTNKELIRRKNILMFFDELIISLSGNNRVWTPKERMWYNRVEKFLRKP